MRQLKKLLRLFLLPIPCSLLPIPYSLLPLAACDQAAFARPKTDFSGEKAMTYVEAQLVFGPRPPGSPAHEKTADWIAAEMATRADTVIVQRWEQKLMSGQTLPMRNILARFRPGSLEHVLYLTHWDT